MVTKEAQKRNVWDRFVEKLDFPGRVLETFDSEFSDIMDGTAKFKGLRQVDDETREKAIELNGILKSARTNFKNREYILSVHDLVHYYSILEEIIKLFTEFTAGVMSMHHNFLFDNMDKEQVDRLREMNKKVSFVHSKLIKSAGLSDMIGGAVGGAIDSVTDGVVGLLGRPTATSAWEKRFPSKFKEFKKSLSRTLDRTESLHISILNYFKKLNKARNSRKLEEYVSEVSRFSDNFRKMYEEFKSFYKAHLKSMVEAVDASQAKKVQDSSAQPSVDSSSMDKDLEELKRKMNMPTGGSVQQAPYAFSQNQPPLIPSQDNGTPNSDLENAKTEIRQDNGHRKIRLAPANPMKLPDGGFVNGLDKKQDFSPAVQPSAAPKQSEIKTPVAAPPMPLPKKELPHSSDELLEAVQRKASVSKDTLDTVNSVFIINLKKIAKSNNPTLMAREILAYSEAIEEYDSVKSKKLLELVGRILNES